MSSERDIQNIVLENVWQKDVSTLRSAVLGLWLDHGGPTGSAAEERLKQLAFIVRGEHGDIVGISTAFKVYVKRMRNYFFAIRLLLHPDHRIPGLTSKLLVSTRDFLESIAVQEANPAIGIITLVENERLKASRNEAIWPASQMVYIGNSAEGHHIRVYYFKGARIEP
jgi:hypothetical protein